VVYGSLVPLKFTARDWRGAVDHFYAMFQGPFERHSITDIVANFLLMVPLNYCALAALVAGRNARWRSLAWAPVVLLGSTAVSFAVEFLQLWFHDRNPSSFDVVAQFCGAVFGLAAWIGVGHLVAGALQRLDVSRRPVDFVDWALRIYVAALLLWSALPLNMSISPVQWYHKYKEGRVVLVPFHDAPGFLSALLEGATILVMYIPVGMWAATAFTSARRPVRSLGMSIAIGIGFAIAVSALDLIVVPRVATSATLVAGIPGIVIGGVIMRRWRGTASVDSKASVAATGAWPWLAAAAAYALLLVAWFCPPQEILTDPSLIWERFVGFFGVPLRALYYGSIANAVKEVLRKGLLFAPLGGLLAVAVLRSSIPVAARRWMWALIGCIAFVWATGIEIFQVLLPPHVPDLTDVVLCTGGAVVGMLVAIRLHEHRA
jgi:glycopeptide antibiotics resistance protein